MSENGFVATTTSAMSPSPSSATACPASVSSSRAGRRGISRSRRDEPADEQQQRRAPPRTSGEAGPRPRSAAAAAARPRGRRRAWRRRRAAGRRIPRRAAGCGGCARRERAESSSPAAGEEVDRSDRERQERSQEHELHRPAADEARSDVDVARRTLRELEAGVERADQVLGRPAELAQPRGAERASANARDGRSVTVVSVSAGMPRATNGPCSPSVNGKPRSSSWRSAGRARWLAPDSSSTRTAAVRTSEAAGERAVSPPIEESRRRRCPRSRRG